MKSRNITLAILAATTGAAFAQSSITVYGVVDMGLKYENGASSAGKSWSLQSGQQSGSRIGFRGIEDIGGGLTANFVLENGFNADDGSIGNGGRLFGRQAWVGLSGNFGAVNLGRQYSATYNALCAIDPFRINQAGDVRRVYGYGVSKVDPISRSDNTITYSTRSYNGLAAQVGYKFGEAVGNFNRDSSKFAGLAYVSGPLNFQASYQNTDGVSLGAATTQLGAIVAPAGLGSSTVAVKNAFIGAIYDFGPMKAHVGFGDTKLNAIGSARIRSTLLALSAPVGTGSVYASWNHGDIRDLAGMASNQYAVGYTYSFSKRTNFYSSASYTKNDSGVRLNAAANGASGREIQAGIRHLF